METNTYLGHGISLDEQACTLETAYNALSLFVYAYDESEDDSTEFAWSDGKLTIAGRQETHARIDLCVKVAFECMTISGFDTLPTIVNLVYENGQQFGEQVWHNDDMGETVAAIVQFVRWSHDSNANEYKFVKSAHDRANELLKRG